MAIYTYKKSNCKHIQAFLIYSRDVRNMAKQDWRWNTDKPSATLDPSIPIRLTISPANHRSANFWIFSTFTLKLWKVMQSQVELMRINLKFEVHIIQVQILPTLSIRSAHVCDVSLGARILLTKLTSHACALMSTRTSQPCRWNASSSQTSTQRACRNDQLITGTNDHISRWNSVEWQEMSYTI